MVEKKQFTLKWMLVQVTLLAIVFALFRWVFLTRHPDPSELEVVLLVLSWIVASSCFGAAIGGFFGRFWVGAISGMFLFFIALYLVSFFLH